MSARSALGVLLLLTTCSMAVSCGGGSGTAQMVQMCLHAEEDVDHLVGLLEQAASAHGLKFINRSKASQLELASLGKDPGYRVVTVSASRQDGLGLAAGNLSLGAQEVAVGFTNGADSQESAAFIRGVADLLRSKWVVRPVADGQGAVKSDCRSQ